MTQVALPRSGAPEQGAEIAYGTTLSFIEYGAKGLEESLEARDHLLTIIGQGPESDIALPRHKGDHPSYPCHLVIILTSRIDRYKR